MFKLRDIIGPVCLATALLAIGLLASTALQGQPTSVFAWRLGYAVMGAYAVTVILLAWPGPAPQQSNGAWLSGLPSSGDTHQHLDDTEAACACMPPIPLSAFSPAQSQFLRDFHAAEARRNANAGAIGLHPGW